MVERFVVLANFEWTTQTIQDLIKSMEAKGMPVVWHDELGDWSTTAPYRHWLDKSGVTWFEFYIGSGPVPYDAIPAGQRLVVRD